MGLFCSSDNIFILLPEQSTREDYPTTRDYIPSRIITLRELTEVQTTRLDARGKWMIDLTASLKEWLDDRWIVSDEQQTWDQLFDSNPGLAIPTGFIPYNREHNPITLPNPPY